MLVEEEKSMQVPPIIEAKAKGMRICPGRIRVRLQRPKTAGRKTAVVVVLCMNEAMKEVAGRRQRRILRLPAPATLWMAVPKLSITPVLMSAPESTKIEPRTMTISEEKPANASFKGRSFVSTR